MVCILTECQVSSERKAFCSNLCHTKDKKCASLCSAAQTDSEKGKHKGQIKEQLIPCTEDM